MGLREQQRAWVRLTTDEDARARFFADPDSAASAWGLSSQEAEGLVQRRAEVERFASSLWHKRLHEAEYYLPRLTQNLGDRFASLYRTYTRTVPDAGQQQRRVEAVGFARYVGHQEPACRVPARLDEGACRMADPARLWHACRLEGLGFAMWWRWRKAGVVRHLRM